MTYQVALTTEVVMCRTLSPVVVHGITTPRRSTSKRKSHCYMSSCTWVVEGRLWCPGKVSDCPLVDAARPTLPTIPPSRYPDFTRFLVVAKLTIFHNVPLVALMDDFYVHISWRLTMGAYIYKPHHLSKPDINPKASHH